MAGEMKGKALNVMGIAQNAKDTAKDVRAAAAAAQEATAAAVASPEAVAAADAAKVLREAQAGK